MAKMEKLPFKETFANNADRYNGTYQTHFISRIQEVYCNFVEDYSRFAIAYFVKSKDEAGEVLKSTLYLLEPCWVKMGKLVILDLIKALDL